jgi:hypothetical protein
MKGLHSLTPGLKAGISGWKEKYFSGLKIILEGKN